MQGVALCWTIIGKCTRIFIECWACLVNEDVMCRTSSGTADDTLRVAGM